MAPKANNAGILVVDHDVRSLEDARLILEGRGFEVYTALDGVAALETFRREQPGMVILAAMLPKLHGFEVCKSIKSSDGGAGIPVVITTKLYKNEKYKRQAMRKFKADDFLVKPLNEEKLISLLQKHFSVSLEVGGRLSPPVNAGAPRYARTKRSSDSQDHLEQILEETLAGLMRSELTVPGKPGSSANGGMGSRSALAGHNGIGASAAGRNRGQASVGGDEAVIPGAIAGLSDVAEEDIDRIVDNLDFLSDVMDAPEEEEQGRPPIASEVAGVSFGADVRPRREPKRKNQGSHRPTVAVTPVEMIRRQVPPDPSATRSPAPPAVRREGQVFGKFQLLKKIATGGMAEVFRAKQIGVEGFEKLVALKRILPHLTDNEEFIKMFIDEGKLAAQLTHTNIVQIYELGEVDNSFYIAMEYVHGKNLKQILHRARQMGLPMTIEKAVTIAAKICKALDYAHRKCDMSGNPLKLVHRDVSPQNILISYEGEVKLVDFGIAKAARQASITRAGALKGKILYMSPEQAWGKPIDHRSDIYSVGNILYEMLTDRKLFAGKSEIDILKKVRDPNIVEPSQYAKDMPHELERIILKALAVDPADRYQDAGLMKRALDKFVFKRKVALGALNLGSYIQNLFQDEFHQDTAESIAQVDLPSRVFGDSSAGAIEPAPRVKSERRPEPRRRPAARPSRQPPSRIREDSVELPTGVERTQLSQQGAPTWLYALILIMVVCVVGLTLYMVIFYQGHGASDVPAEEGTLVQDEFELPQNEPPNTEDLSSRLRQPPDLEVESTDSWAGSSSAHETSLPAEDEQSSRRLLTPDGSYGAAASLEAEGSREPVPAAVPVVEPTSPPTPTIRPRTKPTRKTAKKPRRIERQPAVSRTVPGASRSGSRPRVVYGDTPSSSRSQRDRDAVIIVKRAGRTPTPAHRRQPAFEGGETEVASGLPRDAVAPAVAGMERGSSYQPGQGTAPTPTRRPVRENDLVQFPDNPLEDIRLGKVSLSKKLRRKIKRALGKHESLSVRFFARAEISMEGEVTGILQVLGGAERNAQLAKILSEQELKDFNNAFIAAAKASRYKPLTKDGVRVRSHQTVFFQVRVP